MDVHRRSFIKNSALTLTGCSLGFPAFAASNGQIPIFEISLAEWSLHRLLFAGKMDHLDFAIEARRHKIDAIEYVNQFFMDKATDRAYLREMKDRADGEGVRSLLIMCDREGALGHPDAAKRREAVKNHHKWADAARYLGCHSIRVNGFSGGSWGSPPDDYEESMKLVADGLRQLCEYADTLGLNVLIENHGGNSSNAQWLMGVMAKADHPRAGTLPDFGNFQIYHDRDNDTRTSYDSYRGIAELMPLAKSVSVKTTAWDDRGNQSDLDYERMLKIVLDTGYRGYCGIEHSEEGRVWDSIVEVRQRLLETRDKLRPTYR